MVGGGIYEDRTRLKAAAKEEVKKRLAAKQAEAERVTMKIVEEQPEDTRPFAEYQKCAQYFLFDTIQVLNKNIERIY